MSVMDRLPEFLRGTRIARELEEEEQTARTTERAAAGKRRAQLEREFAKAIPGLRAAAAQAAEQLQAAAAAHQAAAAAATAAEHAVRDVTARYEHDLRQLVPILRRTAPPEIDAAIDALSIEYEQERATPAERGTVQRRGRPVTVSNHESIGPRLVGMVDAQRQLDSLKENPTANVPAQIARIRAAIPQRFFPEDAPEVDTAALARDEENEAQFRRSFATAWASSAFPEGGRGVR